MHKGATEYNQEQKETFKKQASEETVLNEKVRISDFAFSKFQELREEDGIDYAQILESLSPSVNNKAVFKAGESTGKSGSFFFFSHDRKFIIKTMFQEELNIMMENLPRYFDYITSTPHSLIARIYGVFQVQMEGMVPVNLLVMANTIQITGAKNKVEKVYDLKGSTINRHVSREENQTMKDMNLMSCRQRRTTEKRAGLLQFENRDIREIRETIKEDAEFLKELELLDYSLLLAVERVTDPE